MSFVPLETGLGELEILEVFDFYDIPRLFLTQNQLGTRYLAISVEETRTESQWLYLPVSGNRLVELRASDLELRDAFLRPETEIIHVTIDASGARSSAIADILEEWLPAGGHFLYRDTESLSTSGEDPTARLARESGRDAIRLSLEFGRDDILAPLQAAGRIWTEFQRAVEPFAVVPDEPPGRLGRLPADAVGGSRLNLVGVQAGSLVAEIITQTVPDLFGRSVASEGIEGFLSTLGSILDGPRHDELQGVTPRARARVEALAQSLSDADAAAEIQWRAPRRERALDVRISKRGVQELLAYLTSSEVTQTEEFDILGRLVGFNERTKSFEFFEFGREQYKGGASDELVEEHESFKVGGTYKARIRATVELDTSYEEKTKYELLSLVEDDS